jgi:hypothetical protein
MALIHNTPEKKHPRKNRSVGLRTANNVFGFPANRRTTLRYVDYNSYTITSGVIAQVFYSVNNLFDPNTSGGGHQPMGFDQWAAIYNHYVVVSCDVSVRFTHPQGTGTIVVGVNLHDDTTAAAAYSTLVEQGKGAWSTLVSGFGETQRTLKYHYDAKNWFNITNIKDNLDRLGGPVTGGPGDNVALGIWGQSIDYTQSGSFQAVVQMDFLVDFSEPKDLPAS